MVKRKSSINPGIRAVSGLGEQTYYDEIWLIDCCGYVTECGALMSDGEIWLVDSHDRTTALVIADSKEVQSVKTAAAA
jgi:hypothetical protein